MQSHSLDALLSNNVDSHETSSADSSGRKQQSRVTIAAMELVEIQQAIGELPKDQQTALLAWLFERDDAEWDSDMERDFSFNGPGMALIDEMKADFRAGKFRPFEQGPPQKR